MNETVDKPYITTEQSEIDVSIEFI